MSKEEQSDTIYEARDEKILSSRDGKLTIRLGRFLKPCAKTLNQAVGIPNTPLLSEIFSHNLQQWPSKVCFKGWKNPLKKWEEWMEKLAGRYGAIWNQTGICDSILSSSYEIRCNHNLVTGLCEFWCPETNTFVFPWGEATITLEDVMILGGFPVLGEPVTLPLKEETVKIEEEMDKKRREMSRNKAKKASHSGWMTHFMENESEFEHVAFLSLWLSRHVFPTLAEHTIQKHVFPIAIHLSRGMSMALAPAVLASLYQNLRLLRKQAMIGSLESICVSGPFQLVELWACERFPNLAPSSPNLLKLGEPRAARWHKLSSKISLLPVIRSTLKLEVNFQWRPYAANLENWHSSFHKEYEQHLLDYSSLDEELHSFVNFLCASELVGLDCKEKYMPYRVARQFGFDQDLPGEFPRLNFPSKNVAFFIPPRSFEPGVTVRYFDWWDKAKSARKDALLVQEIFLKNQSKENNGDDHATVATMRSKKQKKSREVSKKSKKENGHVLVCTTKSNISQVETGKNEDDCHTSVASRRSQQDPLKMSQVLNNSNGEESHASVTPEPPPSTTKKWIMKYSDSSDDDMPQSFLNLPPSKTKKPIIEDSNLSKYDNPQSPLNLPPKTKKRIIEDSESSEDNIPRSPLNLPPSKTNKPIIEDSATSEYDIPRSLLNIPPSKTKKLILEDSSDDDNLMISEYLKRRAAGSASRTSPHKLYPCSTTPSATLENSRKRKLYMTREGKGSRTQSVHGAFADEVKKEASDSANNNPNWVAKEVKREVYYSADNPFELFEVSNNAVKSSIGGAVKGGVGRKNAGV